MIRVVVMGVSGCGKSTLAQLLSQRLGLAFVEGDQLHPPENVRRMAAGIALTDEDRQGWLQSVGRALACAQGPGVVVSCSALKRRYRDVLRQSIADFAPGHTEHPSVPPLPFLHLAGPYAVLQERMAARIGHYMPASLLKSQYEALEPPQPPELALNLDVSKPPKALATEACEWLSTTRAGLTA